jgi:putative tryptophan/tyrosine transport system substrate-binding protein
MKEKLTVITLCAMLFALCFSGEARQPAKIPKIGWLGARSASAPAREVFLREFRELGYVEGKNIAFEYRYAEGKLDQLPALVDELIQLKVDVLLAPSTPAAVAAKNATKTIPIVFYSGSDPVAAGLVDSFARPGENITGFTTISVILAGKRLELLKETVPQAHSRCGVVESAGCFL